MSETGLIPVFGTRPAVVMQGSCRVYVSVHDQGFLHARADWKRRLRAAHPDAGRHRNGWTFRHLRRAFEAWLLSEQAWYAQFGLQPPDWSSHVATPPPAAAPRKARPRPAAKRRARFRDGLVCGHCGGSFEVTKRGPRVACSTSCRSRLILSRRGVPPPRSARGRFAKLP